MTRRSSGSPALWDPSVTMETRPDGSIIVKQDKPLGAFPRAMTERFLHWAEIDPGRIWMAERSGPDSWRRMSYGEAARRFKAIGSVLLGLGLSAERPLLILSGNSIDHALMALGAQHVGIPSAAIAPAYSTASRDYSKLQDIAAQMTPGALYADRADVYAAAVSAVFDPAVPLIASQGGLSDRSCFGFEDICRADPGLAVEIAHQAVGPDTVAKFLFTSGTTGSPKAVIQTQRMLCSNQEMVASCYAFMRDTPPVVVDWAPWNHTASGNKVFNLVIYNGGTYYIDEGKPTPHGIGKTIANLKEVAPTWYFNVPVGYQMLLDTFERDHALRETFFSHLDMLMYAGAGMSQPVWDRMTAVSHEMVPGGVLLCTGFGATETGPFALMCTDRQDRSGNLGIPAFGVELKLVPQGDKYEARVRSPSVTPGYWRNQKLTNEVFDEEGFYSFGDALRFAHPDGPRHGFYFDGRLAENFKLNTGTWVAVGALRATLVNDLKGLGADAVIAGENREDLGALILPDWSALKTLAGEPGLEGAALLAHPKVRAAAAEMLASHGAKATGSANRVMRLMFIETPLDFDKGEVTDKGSINQRAVLRHRDDLVERLWSDDPRVIHPAKESVG